jgi:peptide/nickel transport system substrate-binding protein
MKDNLGMYFFIAFIVVMLIIAVCIINSNIDNQSFTEAKAVRKEEEIIKNINLAISDFDTINPILSNNQEVQNISKLIYEPLITLTEDYNLEACLATDWAKLNDTTYIIKLRENVTWSDGKKFTGADVK